jgi:hypothetical protein
LSQAATVSSVRPAMDYVLERARRRLELPGRRTLVLADDGAETAAGGGAGPFDAAWIAPVRLEGLDVARLGRVVSALLRPGAPLACVIPGCWPLCAILERALLGLGDLPSPRRARIEGRPPGCLSVAEWKAAFGPGFRWHRLRAVGVLAPARSSGIEVERHAFALGLLAAVEHVVGGWPIVRALGDRLLLEGVRR